MFFEKVYSALTRPSKFGKILFFFIISIHLLRGFPKKYIKTFFGLMRKRVKKLAENEFKWLYFYLKNVFYHCLIKILVANTKNDKMCNS